MRSYMMKAWVGALVAGLGAAATALDDGRILAAEALTVVAAALTALSAVYVVANREDDDEGSVV